MTDRSSLEDLDAASEPARWCCSGNAEDCPLCDPAALPYPWICPGHPDTAENRQRAQAATEATEPAQWSQLEAHAFNAVQPALREAGRWLPMSARRAVAQAVLAAIQPHLAGHYQHAVNAAVAAEQRATQAEAAITRVWQAIAERRTEVAERETDGMLPLGTPGASWCDAVTVTCDRIEDALRTFPQPAAIRCEPAHDAGPTVRECADNDRRWWNGEKVGEQL